MASMTNFEIYKQFKGYEYYKANTITQVQAEEPASGKGLIPVNPAEVVVMHDVNLYEHNLANQLNYVVWSRIPCYLPEDEAEFRLSKITGSPDPSQATLLIDMFPNVVVNNDSTVEVKFRVFYNKPYVSSPDPNKYKEITLHTDRIHRTTEVTIGEEVDIGHTEIVGSSLSVIVAQAYTQECVTCIELDELGTRMQLFADNDDLVIMAVTSRTDHHGAISLGMPLSDDCNIMYINEASMVSVLNEKAQELEDEMDDLSKQIGLASNYFITR